ncbi:hypothetical protein [Candidatus Ichthyocystis hellenicum]|uniref:hypothetical protein n=1 Tax=Candidatus Ichthyocystis hellenicum TaxID=1561003 RepID=UPI000B882B76|nr:hypothetical protein [Candidatus Ichthyocystis hellenicum]
MDNNILPQPQGEETQDSVLERQGPVSGASRVPLTLQSLDPVAAGELPPPYEDGSAPPSYYQVMSLTHAATVPSLVVTSVRDVGEDTKLKVAVTTRDGVTSNHFLSLMGLRDKINSRNRHRCSMNGYREECPPGSPCFLFRGIFTAASALTFFLFGMASSSYYRAGLEGIHIFVFIFAFLLALIGFFIGYEDGELTHSEDETL